jgi:hypothetical protein
MLESRVDQLEAALARLADAQAQTQADLGVLTQRVDTLTQRLDTLTQRVDQLTDALRILTGEVKVLKDHVGNLRGDNLERRYREHASAYFSQILSRMHTLSSDEIDAVITDAEDSGAVPFDAGKDVRGADIILRGRRRDTQSDAYLVIEVSTTIDKSDVERAKRRADLLARATGLSSLPAVAGEGILADATRAAQSLGVWRVTNGH